MRQNKISLIFETFFGLNRTILAEVTLVGRPFIFIESHGHFILNVYTRENALWVWVDRAFKFILNLIVLVDNLNLDYEGERAALLPLWLADDVTAELSDQLTANVQSKSDSPRVDFLSFLEEPIHFEKLRHVFFPNAHASVSYTDLQQVISELEFAKWLW
jgi:hypothetical protein